MVKTIGSIVLFLALFIALVRYIELTSIFYPMRQVEVTPKVIGLDYEEVYLKTEDGLLLNGWLIKKSEATTTVIFFHGNAGNISHRLDKISVFYQLGLNIFIIDYRGYGKSQGRPSEQGLYKDGRAAYDYIKSRKDLGDKIIAYGESLGSAAAIDLCLSRKPNGLIIDSAFTSAKEMAKTIYPFVPSFLIFSRFDSISKVKEIKIPKLFIHSINDEIVPFSLGEKLFNLASPPKELLKIIGGHNSGFFDSEGLITERLRNFLREFHFS